MYIVSQRQHVWPTEPVSDVGSTGIKLDVVWYLIFFIEFDTIFLLNKLQNYHDSISCLTALNTNDMTSKITQKINPIFCDYVKNKDNCKKYLYVFKYHLYVFTYDMLLPFGNAWHCPFLRVRTEIGLLPFCLVLDRPQLLLSVVYVFRYLSVPGDPLYLWMTGVLFLQHFTVVKCRFFTRFQLQFF